LQKKLSNSAHSELTPHCTVLEQLNVAYLVDIYSVYRTFNMFTAIDEEWSPPWAGWIDPNRQTIFFKTQLHY